MKTDPKLSDNYWIMALTIDSHFFVNPSTIFSSVEHIWNRSIGENPAFIV